MKGELNKVVEDGRAAISVALNMHRSFTFQRNQSALPIYYSRGYMHTTIGRKVGQYYGYGPDYIS